MMTRPETDTVAPVTPVTTMNHLKPILESLLLIAEEPLSLDKIKPVLPELSGREITTALDQLAAEYDRRNAGFCLSKVAGGYQLRTRPEYTEYIRRLIQPKPARLSKAALETLAIIAYKQPVLRADIERIRGVDSGGVLRALLERKMVRILGRREIPGRPLIYATTRLFLEVFGLKDLTELPSADEIESFSNPETADAGLETEAGKTPDRTTAPDDSTRTEGALPIPAPHDTDEPPQ